MSDEAEPCPRQGGGPQKSAPRISVIIPVYNARRYVREAVRSALDQEGALEIILVEDGSSDGSLEECEALVRDCAPRVRLLRHPGGTNRGPAPSRNLALENARGEYVAFLDADDRCLPDRFALEIDYLKRHEDVAMVCGDAVLIDEEGRRIGMKTPGPKRWSDPERGLVLGNMVVFSSALVRRAAIDAVGVLDPRYRYAHDYDLWVRMVMAGMKLAYLADPLCALRVWPGQISTERSREQALHARRVHLKYLKWVLRKRPDLRADCAGVLHALRGQASCARDWKAARRAIRMLMRIAWTEDAHLRNYLLTFAPVRLLHRMWKRRGGGATGGTR